MNFFQFLESNEYSWPDGYWIDPEGNIYELKTLQTHTDWMLHNTNFKDIEEIFDAGWGRLIVSGNDLYLHMERANINYKQRGKLIKFCENNLFDNLLLDKGNHQKSQVIWTAKRG